MKLKKPPECRTMQPRTSKDDYQVYYNNIRIRLECTESRLNCGHKSIKHDLLKLQVISYKQ